MPAVIIGKFANYNSKIFITFALVYNSSGGTTLKTNSNHYCELKGKLWTRI